MFIPHDKLAENYYARYNLQFQSAVILLPAHPASFAHKFLFQRVPVSPGMQ